MTSFVERCFIVLILFYSALVLCLPVPFSSQIAQQYPWWAVKITLGKIQLHEFIFLVWLVFYGWRYVLRSLLNCGNPVRLVALLLIVLALWCGLVSMMSPLFLLDLGRTFRLLLNALLLLAVVRWASQLTHFPLVMLVSGFFVGTFINLIISFQYPFIVNGMMRLSGQNTPGVAMGVAIHLAAWLFYRNSHIRGQVFALFSSLLFIFACTLSYSRIGWFVGGFGGLAWAYVLLIAPPLGRLQQRRMRNLRLVFVPLLILSLTLAPSTKVFQRGFEWIQDTVEHKISRQEESNDIRWAYFTGTAEIILRYPFGVGYSGFYDAMTRTEVYGLGNAAEEDSPAEANPHSTFLWYAAAGGVPGSFLAIIVTLMLLNSMRIGLARAIGRPGLLLFFLVAIPYVIIGLTVPYLLNSIILIVPTAIVSGLGWAQRVGHTNHSFCKIDH